MKRFLVPAIAVVLLSGCSVVSEWFAPHVEAAQTCADVTSRSSAQTCVAFLKISITDAADVGAQKVASGALSVPERNALADRLQNLLNGVRAAEQLLAAGDLTTAQGQLNAVVLALESVERKLGKRGE